MSDLNLHVSRRIRVALGHKRISLRAAADQMGLSRGGLDRKIRTGQRWTVNEVVLVAYLTGRPIEWFLPLKDRESVGT
ncbi:hypothetical protein [Curtobacterium sp. PhB78]|uniref:hypothetical protein n=1 Tax=Curtobacterium sp. PhB78 TaxID=2485102 RepID=UPI000FA248B7|nr:hypothetical protein [Curtobacterium sp. PhB78]ROS34535.1 hypothetical protein EDF53_3096 [Curtobacterium sp. PhB78]